MEALNGLLSFLADTPGWVKVFLDAAAKSFLILAAAGLFMVTLRRSSAALRHLVWLWALVSLFILPLLSLALPAWRLPILPSAPIAAGPAPAMPQVGPAAVESAAAIADIETSTAEPPAPVEPTPAPLPPASIEPVYEEPGEPVLVITAPAIHWSVWVLAFWLTGAFLSLLPFLIGTVRVWLIARRARPVQAGSSWALLWQELTREHKLRGRAQLLESERVSIPMMWGLFRPIVLVPAEGRDWTEGRQRVVLLHELAHARRKDCLTQTLAQFARALYWFNPLVWLGARRLRIERERACDDVVLNAGLKPSSYASHLLELALSLRRKWCTAAAAVTMARPKSLEGRIMEILDAKRSRKGLTRLGVIMVLMVCACALPLLAAIEPSARAAQIATEEEKLIFGPVIERSVKDSRQGKDCYIDFDTGRLPSPPSPDIHRDGNAFSAWINEAGVDAVGIASERERGLGGFHLVALPVANERWNASPIEVARRVTGASPAPITHVRASQELPATFFIKTREGGIGILEIQDNAQRRPEELSVRFQMLSARGAKKAARLVTAEPSIRLVAVANLKTGETVDKQGNQILDMPERPPVPDPERLQAPLVIWVEVPGGDRKSLVDWSLADRESGGYLRGGGSKRHHTYETEDGTKVYRAALQMRLPLHVARPLELRARVAAGNWYQVGNPVNVQVLENYQSRSDAPVYPLSVEGIAVVQLEQKGNDVRLSLTMSNSIWKQRVFWARATRKDGGTIEPLSWNRGTETISVISFTFSRQKLSELHSITVLQRPCHEIAIDFPSLSAGATSTKVEQETKPEADATFGAVIERVVNDDSIGKDMFIDFDTGRLFSKHEEIEGFPARLDWFTKMGIDALCDTGTLVSGLVGIDIVVHPTENTRWDELTAKNVAEQEMWKFSKPGFPVWISAKGELPATFVIKTREGGVGVLQILELQTKRDPQYIKIRYKLLERVAPAVTVAPEKAVRRIELRDADASRKALDLHTGEFVQWRKGASEEEILEGIDKGGRGDLAYINDEGGTLCFLRGSKAPVKLTFPPGHPEGGWFNYRLPTLLPTVLVVTTREGRRFVVKILEADEKSCVLEYKRLAPAVTPPRAERVRKAYIPDADTRGVKVILDLKTGEMLPAGKGEEQLTYVTKLGKGDLVWNSGILVCLRGGSAMILRESRRIFGRLRPEDEGPGFARYRLDELPVFLLVTTAEDRRYELRLSPPSDPDGGVWVEYRRASLPFPRQSGNLAELAGRYLRLSDLEAVLTIFRKDGKYMMREGREELTGEVRETPSGIVAQDSNNKLLIERDPASSTLWLYSMRPADGKPGEAWVFVKESDVPSKRFNRLLFMRDGTRQGGASTSEPPEKPKEPAHVYIPSIPSSGGFSADAKFVLDLASGEMLPLTSKEDKGYRHFIEIGKGDLAFEDVLAALRGATVSLLKNGKWQLMLPQEEDKELKLRAYPLPELPCRLLVTTGDGLKFEVTVLSEEKGGIHIEYRKIDGIGEQEGERTSTAGDLIRKGLPLIPTWRDEIIKRTASMSLEEVADNLGDMNVMDLCRNQDVYAMGSGMQFWTTALPCNIMILRLIGEGREEPDRVCDILEKTIIKRIEQLPEIRKKQKDKGRRYDAFREAVPTQFSIAGAFYVLANIDRLDNPALLERWIVAPQPNGHEASEIKDWFIDYYFRFTDATNGPHAAAHLATANDRVLAGPRQVSSKWNQAWDVNDPMLIVTGVNVKDFETIEVLSIPRKYPFTFGESIRIKENFHEHVRQLANGG